MKEFSLKVADCKAVLIQRGWVYESSRLLKAVGSPSLRIYTFRDPFGNGRNLSTQGLRYMAYKLQLWEISSDIVDSPNSQHILTTKEPTHDERSMESV